MAIFHYISDSRYTLDGVIRYIRGRLKKGNDVRQTSKHYGNVSDYDGLYVDPDHAAMDMLLFKNICSKEGGSQYKHFVLSLEDNELVRYLNCMTPEGLNRWDVFWDVAWAIQDITKCQLVYAVHTNTKNIHMHIIINPIRMDTYQKLNIDYQMFYGMIGTLNEILRSYRLREIRGGQGFCRDDDDQIINTDDTERKWWNIYPTGIEYLIPQS